MPAVNYHFGDKEQLYVQAVLEAHRCGTELLPDEVFRQGTPAEQLRRYIHHFLSNVLSLSRENSWHHALILREMLRPTSASEILVREAIRPRFERLMGILRRVCPGAEERRLHALVLQRDRPVPALPDGRGGLGRLVGAEAYERLDLDFLTEHITSFCLAALGLTPPLDEAGESAGGEVLSR